MIKKQLTVTRDGEEVPFVEMETVSESRMKMSFLAQYDGNEQKRFSMILTQAEAQDLAKAIDNFSYNFLEEET